ncbi:hypothetical protein Tsp_03414 [Trichinella spiralis]|uniref:hypothetical protein n=1 Tax=Trichinella spiralis TaxID=6334 RepID=UPI0001EFCDC0|nr:hypothetical protein Tsp_03414 [Trichinella spiralis]
MATSNDRSSQVRIINKPNNCSQQYIASFGETCFEVTVMPSGMTNGQSTSLFEHLQHGDEIFNLGIYHSGIEVYNDEYCFGRHKLPLSGIFQITPRNADELGDAVGRRILGMPVPFDEQKLQSFYQRLGQGNKQQCCEEGIFSVL